MTTPEQHQLILFWYPYFKFEQISGIRSSNISSVEFEHIKCGFDQCDTPQYDTTICYFALSEWYLFISILHYQNGIFLLAFSTDVSVTSLLCLVV